MNPNRTRRRVAVLATAAAATMTVVTLVSPAVAEARPVPPRTTVTPAPADHSRPPGDFTWPGSWSAIRHSPPRPAPLTGFAAVVAADVATLPNGSGGAVFHPYANPSRPTVWGVTDLGSCQSWINPSTPSVHLLAVIRHEFGHVLQCRNYGGNYNAAIADAGGLTEIERIADAVALDLGANWTNYTRTPTAFERIAAARLLAGQRMR